MVSKNPVLVLILMLLLKFCIYGIPVILFGMLCGAETEMPAKRPPGIFLWAWERHLDLSFVKPEDAGIAFLAQNMELRSHRVIVQSRRHLLKLHPDAYLTAVVRITANRQNPPVLDDDMKDEAASDIIGLTKIPQVRAIQIDFDATVSQRAFYRSLLFELRKKLDADIRLSITALASWCMFDSWISDLPVDEAVPMLFRMGKEGGKIISMLNSGRDFSPAICRQSIGVSLDEPVMNLDYGRRLYVFSPREWNMDSITTIKKLSEH